MESHLTNSIQNEMCLCVFGNVCVQTLLELTNIQNQHLYTEVESTLTPISLRPSFFFFFFLLIITYNSDEQQNKYIAV